MSKFDWTYITALLSVALGWFLNELGQWFRTMHGDKKIKKQILYNLLETNFIFNKLDTDIFTNILSERVLLRIPLEEQTEELKVYLKQLYSKLIGEIIQKNVAENLDAIEEKYSSAVDNLATIDPVTAYRLNGKTKIMQTFDFLQEYSEKVKQEFPHDIQQIQESIDLTAETIKPDIIKDAISGLEDEIRALAFSINIKTWFKVKRTLKKSKEGIHEDGVKMIDDLLDKIIPKQQS